MNGFNRRLENFLDAPVPYIMGLLRRTHDLEELSCHRGAVCIVDIDGGEMDLPEELPAFPHERELADELRENIARFGGKDGADVLRQHAVEEAEDDDNDNVDANDTMDELNKMISKFESLSSSSRPSLASRNCAQQERLRLSVALREVFVNRFAHMLLSFEHFVIVASSSSASSTMAPNDTTQNFDKISFLSDQRRTDLPFLSRFLETQTFCSFVDGYVDGLDSAGGGLLYNSPFGVRLNALKGAVISKLSRNVVTYGPPMQSASASRWCARRRTSRAGGSRRPTSCCCAASRRSS